MTVMTAPIAMIASASERMVRLPVSPAEEEADAEDHEPDLARHDADRGHPDARRKPEAFRLRPRVADHEGRPEGRGGEDRCDVLTGEHGAPR